MADHGSGAPQRLRPCTAPYNGGTRSGPQCLSSAASIAPVWRPQKQVAIAARGVHLPLDVRPPHHDSKENEECGDQPIILNSPNGELLYEPIAQPAFLTFGVKDTVLFVWIGIGSPARQRGFPRCSSPRQGWLAQRFGSQGARPA
jgi:hypothetical protein